MSNRYFGGNLTNYGEAPSTVEYLVVAGGGAGGGTAGGGGGAGGYRSFTSQILSVGTAYTVTVGSGGSGGAGTGAADEPAV